MANNRMAALAAAAPVASDGQLQRIAQLVAEEDDVQRELETANALVSSAKERLTELRHTRIPQAMIAAQTTSFTTDDGIKVALAFTADGALGSPTTPEEYAERERKIDLIEAHGGAEIIKMSVMVSFPKELFSWAEKCATKVADWLEAVGVKGVRIERLRTIHHQTLKKWVKESMEDGEHEKKFGKPLPLDDLGIWYGQIAKITRPKRSPEECR